jgi:choline dehydrogenase-like flavoprotein
MHPDLAAGPLYDVVIVGGGVAGALMAQRFARARKNVVILEAGTAEATNPANYQRMVTEFAAMGSLRGTPNGPYTVNLSALSPNDSKGDRYLIQMGPERFLSDYLRMLGGSTLHWQGTTLRMVPNDFRMGSEYRQAIDWPIGYDDLEPFYREAEHAIGVSADVEDQRNFGIWFEEDYVYPMKRMPQSRIDQFLIQKLAGATVDLVDGSHPLRVISLATARNSVPNASFNGGRRYVPIGAVGNPESGMRCQGNSSCSPICPVQAKYNAMKTLNAALASGHVEIRTQCVASRLKIDWASGRVDGVEYKYYAKAGETTYVNGLVRGKVIVLAANAIENAVLMLASDVVDKSGQLGCNLMDHPYISLQGLAPEPVYPFRGPDVTSGVESLRDGKFRAEHAAFRASIGNWGWVGEPADTVTKLLAEKEFGRKFRARLQETLTRMVKIGVFLEQLPDPKNRVRIHPQYTDALGNYLPIVNYSYADYTLDGGIAAIERVWPAIVKQSGIEDQTDFTSVPPGFQAVEKNGRTFSVMGPGHIVGTHRMGRSASESVVNSDLRSWVHGNLYAVGAGSMVTIGTSNPTLTLAALSLRAADHILQGLH